MYVCRVSCRLILYGDVVTSLPLLSLELADFGVFSRLSFGVQRLDKTGPTAAVLGWEGSCRQTRASGDHLREGSCTESHDFRHLPIR